jgi:cytochrome c-type biogenesis protein CcsB
MATLLFNAAFGFYIVGLFHSAVGFLTKRPVFFRVAFLSVLVAFCLHSAFLVYRGFEEYAFPLVGMRESLAFFAWTVTLCFLLAHRRYGFHALGLFLLPLVAALMMGTVFVQASPAPEFVRHSWVYLHATAIFLAYGLFLVSFVIGILYLVQERELKNRKPRTFYDRLPSLGVMDELFQKSLVWGFTFMTVGLLAGILWAGHTWSGSWYRDPKVIAAVGTWGIYLLLLYVRLSAGWRGKWVAWISTFGFISVLFTFLGASYLGGQHIFE